MTTRVIVAGATGWVGRSLVRKIYHSKDLELVGTVSRKFKQQNLGELLDEPQI